MPSDKMKDQDNSSKSALSQASNDASSSGSTSTSTKDSKSNSGSEDAGVSVVTQGVKDLKVQQEQQKKLAMINSYLQLLEKKATAVSSFEKKKEEMMKPHKFWDTQPMPKFRENYDVNDIKEGPIDKPKTPEDISAEPYKLPASFEWVNCDIENEKEGEEIYKLLMNNYVEDSDAMFRFGYPLSFLRWALGVPGKKKEYHLGVRQKSNKKLRGFITATPAKAVITGKTVEVVEINFLCVHKKLRKYRLAPVLISEITRRVNRNNVWHAVYTAGVVLTKPVTRAQYWHRSLNPKKTP